MYRKHYNQIAASIKQSYELGDVNASAVKDIAHTVGQFNDNFDYPRFLEACGVQQ